MIISGYRFQSTITSIKFTRIIGRLELDSSHISNILIKKKLIFGSVRSNIYSFPGIILISVY